MSKHTKGSWRVYKTFDRPLYNKDYDDYHLDHSIHNENDTLIATVHYCNNEDKAKVGYLRALTVEEMEANAKLIAAAPELLEAARIGIQLWKIAQQYEGLENVDCMKIADAIKKATE